MRSMLTLDLLRHGEAVVSDPDGDAARALSPRGALLVRRLGAHLLGLGWSPARVFTSPLARARETASLLLEAAHVSVVPERLAELVPEGDSESVLIALAARVLDNGQLLLVGHQPLLGDLIAHLSGDSVMPLHTSELVRIECESPLAKGSGRVRLALRPERLG